MQPGVYEVTPEGPKPVSGPSGGGYFPQREDVKMPNYPDYIMGYDPATMSLLDYLSGKYKSTALDAFRQQALRKGPSSWALLAKQSGREEEAAARERGAREVNSQTAQQLDTLAAKGGLSSGARERAAQEGSKNFLAMSQDLAKQGRLNDLQIGINDESNRVQQLSMLPGMEQAQAEMFEKARAQDISNMVAENGRRNSWNQNYYNQQMQAWAADRQARATEKTAKKGGR